MPIRTYRKSTTYSTPTSQLQYSGIPLTFAPNVAETFYQPVAEVRPPFTMWTLLSNTYTWLKRIVASSTVAGLIIPAALIASGVGFIYLQFQPTIVEKVKEYSDYYDQGTAALVQENYITDRLQYVSNPGADYFQTISSSALNQVYKPDTFSLNYRGKMFLTIPSLGFNRLPITANVESNSKDIYDQILTSSLAHFKGTSLPASDSATNTVIYGHSAGGSYNPRPDDVLAAFTFLKDIKVGDMIILEMDGVQYKYRMSNMDIVEPTDVSVVAGTPGKEMLTLLTCHPPGNNNQRLVVHAIPAN